MAGIIQFQTFCEHHQEFDALLALERFRKSRRPNRPARAPTSEAVTPQIRKMVFHYHAATSLAQHEIAALLNINQGRVNEILNEGNGG